MNEQIQARQPRQRRMVDSTIFMITGIIFLAASLFIIAFKIGTPDGLGTIHTIRPGFENMSIPAPLMVLGALAYPGTPIGLMLFLIGLVNITKKPSLRWLRIAVSILCGILLGLSVLWFLLVSLLLIIGF